MKDLKKEYLSQIQEAEQWNHKKVDEDKHRLHFHLMPPVGWLNDPNGLCQMNGEYHVFFQYSPLDATGGRKFWGHYVSEDLLHWTYAGVPLTPDETMDRHGVYSGSALIKDGKMSLYYTGNVKLEGEYDYIDTGRETNTILVTSEDGYHFGEKKLLLSNAEYPSAYTCHIRDPKVWMENETYYMVLGARKRGTSIGITPKTQVKERQDQGCVLIYKSKDGLQWELFKEMTTREYFAYMLECPDVFAMDNAYVVSVSPQGMAEGDHEFQNLYQSGYFILKNVKSAEDLPDYLEANDFVEWDKGFDFYAPQTFLDEHGRRILIGWAGMPDVDYYNPTVDAGWQHALTVPRELSVQENKVYQYPVEEINALRGKRAVVASGEELLVKEETFDLEIRKEKDASLKIILEQGLVFSYEDGIATLEFACDSDSNHSLGCKRNRRTSKIQGVEEVRVLADTSLLEIYLNHGEQVFTTRYYPDGNGVRVKIDCDGSENVLWKMKAMEIK